MYNNNLKSYVGKYRIKNPKKYKGDPTNVIYRSSWELKLMNYLDSNDSVLQWGSEEIAIPYISPIDGKIHRYFPDFIVKAIHNNEIKYIMIEVKPLKYTEPPVVKKKKTKSYINEVMTWGVNKAKWEAARNFCDKKGWEFRILTEKELFIK